MSHIVQASASEAVLPVAARELEARLVKVSELLPLAARHSAEDVEYVHELRVATRRAFAGMRVFAELLPGRASRRLLKLLRRIRHAAGKARDCDVLLARWRVDPEASRLLRRLGRRRHSAQRTLETTCDRLQGSDRLAGRIARVLHGVTSQGGHPAATGGPTLGEWARSALENTVESFFRAAVDPARNEAALHRFRIRTKQLRYVLEIVAGALPPVFSTEVVPAIEVLQKKLGAITDRRVARDRLLEGHGKAQAARKFERLVGVERAELATVTAAFSSWWTTDRADALHLRFLELFTTPAGMRVGELARASREIV